MKAVVCRRYGPPEVLRIADLPRPVPRDNEVLVRINASTVNSGDARIRALRLPTGLGLVVRLAMGFNAPRQPILGSAFAGIVVECGSAVTRFETGDRVFGTAGMELGCHAEYKCAASEGAIAHIPPDLRDDEAAAIVFGGVTALHFLTKGGVKAGDRVLVVGASGAVGSAAIQLARHLGAEVTGVCGSPNVDLVRSLGADRVIDYMREDFANAGERYDAIMDTTGTASFPRSRHALRDGGRLLMVDGAVPEMLRAAFNKSIIAGTSTTKGEHLAWLGKLASSGELKPVIDRSYAIDDAVEAHRYVDSGRKAGNVVLVVHEPTTVASLAAA